MKIYIISLLIGFSMSVMANQSDKLVGIWVEPSKENPNTLWYLYGNGKAITSSNAFFKKLRWYSKDGKLFITDEKPDGHYWEARYRNNVIKGGHEYIFKDNSNVGSFYAEKISDNPNKPVDFYTVCGDISNTFEVVNTGRFEECKSFVPMDFISSFNKQEAMELCEALVKTRKKEGRQEKCILNYNMQSK